MSWHYLQEQEAASWEGASLDGAPSALLSLMPTPEACCWPASATACCRASRFGTTCAASTAGPGPALCKLCPAGSHAKTSAAPDKAPGLMASDPAFGWKWPGSLAKYDPSSRLWKTRQCSLLGDSTEFSETWPRWGLMRDGEFSELTTWAPPTAANESGSWPTLRRTDADRGGRGDLIQAVRGNTNSHFKLWPTPHGFSKDGKSNGPSGNELGRAVNRAFPTPLARDAHNRSGQAKRYLEQGRVNLQDRNAADGIRGSLNPTWVEWLMGWCLGWTDLKPLEMDKFHSWQRRHGECLPRSNTHNAELRGRSASDGPAPTTC